MRTLNKNVPAHFLLDSLFNNASRNNHTTPVVNKRIPYNIIKNENGYALEFAIPGFVKEDFTLKMEDNKLVVKLEATNKKDLKYTRKEFDFHSFEKKFKIPKNVDTEKISATYENGILMVHLELKEKVSKEINIH
jgi:HSP20 family protein